MSRHPVTKWAQRSDKVYITIELPDAKDVKLNLQPDGHFEFSATSGPDNVPYGIDIELYDNVNVEESKAAITSRHICYLVKKAEEKWWSRLLKKEGKPPVFVKVDWDKWVDEDEEKEDKFGDLDFMDLPTTGMDGDDDDFDDDVDADLGADKDGGDEGMGSKNENGGEEASKTAAESSSEAMASSP